MQRTFTGRVLRHVPYDGVVIRVDGAHGWDDRDKEMTVPFPAGGKLPAVGAHVNVTVEWEGQDW